MKIRSRSGANLGDHTQWRDTEFVQRLYANAVSVPGPTLQQIGEAAAEVSAYVVIGVTEIEGGTLSNTLLYLGPDGRVLLRHRKLIPKGGERTVWGWVTARSSAS